MSNDNELITGVAPAGHSCPVNDYELPVGVIVIMDDDLYPYLVDAADYDIGKIDDMKAQPQPQEWREQGKRRMKRAK